MAPHHCLNGPWPKPLLAFLSALLAATAVAGSGASPPAKLSGAVQPKEHRVIVRFKRAAEEEVGDSDGLQLDDEIERLEAHDGVLSATGLRKLDMIIVACKSQESQEQLIEQLDKDPEVQIAVPDTRVSAHDFAGKAPQSAAQVLSSLPSAWPAACAAHPACAARGLAGDCCPTVDGTALSCCSAQENARVALKSYHGKYLTAAVSGVVTAGLEGVEPTSTFFIEYLGDGNVSLRSVASGHYMSAEAGGAVTANRQHAGALERFHLSRNQNGSVSLLGRWGKYLVAKPWGGVFATSAEVGLWEQFQVVNVAGPNQRFPNDPLFPKLWGMHHPIGNDIDAPEAWNIWTGESGAGITLGVIDTGIDYNHADLREQMWVNVNEIPGNGIDDDENGFIDDVHGVDFVNADGDPWDDQMHGTHCSGTIAGRGNNGLGVAGVTWRGVRLMALKFLSSTGSGETSDAIKAIDYAIAHGARILSNSWGGGGSSSALRVAIERAEAAGILFLAAAGNSGTDNDEEPQFPSNYETANIIAVASTTVSGSLSSFSCYGQSTVDLGAPGSNIWSTTPGQGYESLSGTSMATPHVSGLAALVWTFRPSLSMHQVRDILLKSVKKEPWLEGKVLTGGMINAKNALETAWAFEPPRPPTHKPTSISFVDTDLKVGTLGGVVTFVGAANETDVEYYQVYFVSAAGYMVDRLGDRVLASGQPEYVLEPNGSFALPQYAKFLAVVAGRASGEQPVVPGPGAPPAVELEDIGMPSLLPKAVVWGGDADLRQGAINGTLYIDRAADESTISHYNVYWHHANGTRGELLGSVPATGFLEPTCSGPSCGLIRSTVLPGGAFNYERAAYGDDESAIISASGPATLTVRRFASEQYYDWLSVGTQRFTGSLGESLPAVVELPDGPLAITWFSDSSINDAGWSFDLQQAGARVGFRVASAHPADGVEVVPAYHQTELTHGTVVRLVDYDRTMPPSPAFAPKALSFEDVDRAQGQVAGVAKVQAAGGARWAGVTFYKVDFVDEGGRQLGRGWNHTAAGNGSKVAISIPATTVPAGAVALLARAGNAHGLGSAGASAPLLDMFPSRPANASFTHDDDGRQGYVSGALLVQPAASEAGIKAYVAYWYTGGHKAGKIGSVTPSGHGQPSVIGLPYGTRKRADDVLVVSSYAWGEMSEGRLAKIVDLVEEDRRLQEDGHAAATSEAPPREPWLQRPPAEPPIVAWSEGAEEAQALTSSSAAFGRVRCSVTVPGLDARAAAEPRARQAFAQAVAATLPGVGRPDVHVVRVLAVTQGKAKHVAPGGRSLAEAVDKALGRHPVGATVVFEVEAPEGAEGAAGILDRVEARLILLSNGGAAAARFDAALASELRNARVLLPELHFDRSRVSEPKQLGPRLLAARWRARDAARRLEGVTVETAGQETVEEEAGRAVFSAMVAAAAVCAAAALAAVTFVVRRRDEREAALLEQTGESLETISIQGQDAATVQGTEAVRDEGDHVVE